MAASDLDIDSAFGTFDFDDNDNVSAKDTETYDPFEIGTKPQKKKSSPFKKNKTGQSVTTDANGVTLPPRLNINFKVHEEVSSVARLDSEREGSSDVTVQGTVLAQIVSSDAIKNSPFIFQGSINSGAVDIIPNETFTKTYETRGDHKKVNVIRIPKSTVDYVPIGRYAFTETIDHMPLVSFEFFFPSTSK